MKRTPGILVGVTLSALPGPLFAECTSGGCYDGIAAFLLSLAVYGLVGIVLLVMVSVRKWRRAGVWGLVLVAALALGLPLLTQAWQRVQLWRVESREVLGEPPSMAGRNPLLIAEEWTCESGVCAAVLQGRAALGVSALPYAALEGRDMTAPLTLADLPLEHWTMGREAILRRRVLDAAERMKFAVDVDYVILSRQTWHGSAAGPFERGLELGPGMLMRLGMAPVGPALGRVDLADLDVDYLDLVLTRAALGVPLAPGNWKTVWNDALAPEVVARSLCAAAGTEPDWACQDTVWR